MGMEAVYLRRRRRQCHLATSHRRGIRIRPTPMPRHPRRIRRMYHIVERKFCRCGRYPPEVRTAIPVDGRFEHIVLSSHATSDHAIIWILREAEKAVQLMKENKNSSESITTAPKVQKFSRLQSIEEEHKDALERAVSLNIPHAVKTTDDVADNEDRVSTSAVSEEHQEGEAADELASKQKDDVERSPNWHDLVERLFERTKSGKLVKKEDVNAPDSH